MGGDGLNCSVVCALKTRQRKKPAMAILKNHKAWIEDEDGRAFDEYATKVEGDVVTCYIESKVDKVRWY